MTDINWKLCEGCYCHDSDCEHYHCDSQILPNILEFLCPCVNCLIKSCCSTACNEFAHYLKKFEENCFKYWLSYKNKI